MLYLLRLHGYGSIALIFGGRVTSCDVAIIGAGPYGLSAAAHLRTIAGLDVQVFGEPMSFWDRNMPRGMLLRSNWTATQIADPDGSKSLEAYQAASRDRFQAPVPLEAFVRYGLWYQRQTIPDLDTRKIERVDFHPSGFRITIDDGSIMLSRRVIVAGGIGPFAHRPSEFQGVPCALASHASAHRDLGKFARQRVLVVGGGQSALESGALLHEAGAEVEIVTRSPEIHWLQGWASKTLHHRLGQITNKLLYAPTDVGPAAISQLMARPDLLRKFPRSLQNRLRKRSTRPAGARWLVDRLRDVPIRLGCSVTSVKQTGAGLKIGLGDQGERIVDHVLLGTGYRVDISKYAFLSPDLLTAIRQVNGYPSLRRGLETSVDGLHIIGAPAAWSFGPLMQFVSGARYASQALMGVIAGKQGVSARAKGAHGS